MNTIKKLIHSYNVFTPKMYTIAYLGGGTLFFCFAALVLKIVIPAPFMLMTIACFMMFSDIMLDMFVFQGILSKNYDFGLLANSHCGLAVIRTGVLADQLRRLLQIGIVYTVAGMIAYPDLAAEGYFTGGAEYAGFVLALILAVYSGNTFVLHITRKYENFLESMLVINLFSVLEGALLLGMMGVFFREEPVEPFPWILIGIVFAIVLTYSMCETIGLRYKDSFGIRKAGRFGDDSKQKMMVFLSIAFGVDLLMIPVMMLGLAKGYDLSVFLVAQMMYPACGVVLAKLYSYNEGKLPKFSYYLILLLGAVCMVFAVLSVSVPVETDAFGEGAAFWYMLASGAVMVIDIVFLIAVCACGKEKRENAGYRFKNPGRSVGMAVLFLILYFTYVLLQMVVYGIQEGDWSVMSELWANLTGENAVVVWIGILINLPLTFIMFLGEEYGWRYFMQPRMEKRFGVMRGTIVLGILWGLWHCGADFMYYSVETGPQMLVAQIVACISLGIFFAYAYRKTQNIWVPVLMHFFNNNLVLVISGEASTEAFQGKVLTWGQIPVYILCYAVMWLFIFTPTMRGKKNADAPINSLKNTKEAENV